MAAIKKKEGILDDHQGVDDAFRNRLDDSRLLHVIERIYKKEYGYSSRKYLLTSAPRAEAERILQTIESAPASITKMFKRRLDGKYKKDEWIPMIPFPAIKRVGEKKQFVEEVHSSGGFVVDFPRLAAEGKLLYTTMKPSEFLHYAYGGKLIKERSDDDVPTTESNVKRKERQLGKGRRLKTPYLKLDLASCRFVLHDGRHRVVAADERGVKEIPVMIEHQIPRGRDESTCLHDRSRWRREDKSSPNLRGLKHS